MSVDIYIYIGVIYVGKNWACLRLDDVLSRQQRPPQEIYIIDIVPIAGLDDLQLKDARTNIRINRIHGILQPFLYRLFWKCLCNGMIGKKYAGNISKNSYLCYQECMEWRVASGILLALFVSFYQKGYAVRGQSIVVPRIGAGPRGTDRSRVNKALQPV